MDFLDTNILVYAASEQLADAPKATLARNLLRRESGGFAISLQVLQEFYRAVRSPKKLGLSHDEAVRFCQQWRQFTLLEPTLELFDLSVELCQRYQLSYFDAAILAAAKQLGCVKVYSEDLNDGQDYDGVRVENPFRQLTANTPPP